MHTSGGFFYRMKIALTRFMSGRYGTDKLNLAILGLGIGLSLLNVFLNFPVVNLVLVLSSYVLLGFALFRTFSRNTYKRYAENRKFLGLVQKIKDRQHRYYNCPRCRQQVRVPRGKGKISITCPRCKERFVKKT